MIVTPGMRTPTLNMFLPVGSASSSVCVMTVCRVVACTSTIGVSPVTVMVSATLPTFMSTFSVAMNEPVSSIPSRFTVLNPVSVKVTV